MSMIFISHDLAVVLRIADRVLVLERGVVRESGRVDHVLAEPEHEYTRTLLEAAPRVPQLTAGTGARP